MHKLAIFDMDGTLLNTLGDLQNAGNYSLSQLGFPVCKDREAYRHFIGNGLRNQLRLSLPETSRDEETIDKMYSIYTPYYETHMSVDTCIYDGITDMLQRLKAQGILLAILSNKPDAYVMPLAEHYFPSVFDVTQGQRTGVPIKPDPAGLFELLSRFQVEKKDCVYVGDSYVDVKTGSQAGIKTAAVSWGYCTKEELINAGSTSIVDNCEQLYKIIVDK